MGGKGNVRMSRDLPDSVNRFTAAQAYDVIYKQMPPSVFAAVTHLLRQQVPPEDIVKACNAIADEALGENGTMLFQKALEHHQLLLLLEDTP